MHIKSILLYMQLCDMSMELHDKKSIWYPPRIIIWKKYESEKNKNPPTIDLQTIGETLV